MLEEFEDTKGSVPSQDLISFDLIFFVYNATFSNISAVSWRPVLVVGETGVPGENH
jgi:hypothetical protein